jgi:hypothetical protein
LHLHLEVAEHLLEGECPTVDLSDLVLELVELGLEADGGLLELLLHSDRVLNELVKEVAAVLAVVVIEDCLVQVR